MSGAALALALATLAATPAFDAHLARGEAAWHAMSLERAASSFERARRRAKSDEERARAWVWLGVVRCELGDFPAAKHAFVAALRLAPDATLPAHVGELPPRTRGLFEAARIDVEGPRPLPREPVDDEGPSPAPPPAAPPLPRDAPDAPDDAPDPQATRAPPEDAAQEAREGPPLLALGALALAGSGAALVGAAALLDVAAGPDALDGGPLSLGCLLAGGALVATGAGVGIAALVAE